MKNKKKLFIVNILSIVIFYLNASPIKHIIQTQHQEIPSHQIYNNIQKTVFLTGAAGFIGSNFLEYMFNKYPNYHFLVLDALTYAGNLENIPKNIHNSNRFEFFYGSVTNFHIVDLLMSRSDFVVHFAAESHVTRSIADDTTFFDTDVMGTRIMMTALTKYKNKVERFIHISTSEVCGTAETVPMDETHPVNPRSPYAAAKAGADRLVFSYCCTYDVPAIIIRPFNNYGPRQHLEKVIPRFITSALNGEPLTVHGTGFQTRDYMHTYDLCKALDKALHIKNFNKIKGRGYSCRHWSFNFNIRYCKNGSQIFDLPSHQITLVSDRPGQVECHQSSTKKAKELLNWKAQINFEDGIKQTIEWYLQNKKCWKKMETMKYVPIYTNDNITELQ